MKKKLTTILVLFILTWNADAQKQKERDSLQIILDTITDPLTKTKILGRLHELTMFSNPELARSYAEEGLLLSEQIDYLRGVAVGYMQIANYFTNRNENDSAIHYYQIAQSKFEVANSIRGLIFVTHSLAGIERDRGNYENAIALVNKNISLYENRDTTQTDLGDFNLIGAEYEVLGSIYMDKGNYRLALQETLKAARFFNDIQDEIREADALVQLGNIEYAMGNYASALSYSENAYKIYSKHSDLVYQSYAANAAGLAAAELGYTDKAIDYQYQAIGFARDAGVKSALSVSLKDLARIYIKNQDYTEAKKLLHESLQIAREIDVKLNIASALEELAVIDLKTKATASALIKLNELISITESIGALPFLSTAHEKRSLAYETLNNQTAALKDYKKYHLLHDSIYNIKKSQQIEELKTIYETEKKVVALALQEEEIKTLSQEVEIGTLRKKLYAGGMFTFVAVSILLYFGFSQRIKKNRIARENQEEIYKKEIEFKRKELASQTLHLVKKNTFLQELKDNLERINSSPELFKIQFRRIVMLLKKENTDDKDWEVFKSYFSEVHDDFDKKLAAVYEGISEKELRVAALVKMKLSNKEIAAMLNVMPESVIKSKYRLKKKLSLDKDTDLYQYFNSL
jgi:tetratricopeptide (TPR) repeat protein